MPRAGFYAIQATTIRFGRDGNWYADGERITNLRIADLFARHLTRDPAGGYMIRMGDERAHIEVDDTPYVVIAVQNENSGGITIELNDRTRETLDVQSLRIGAADVLYCQVKGGREPARFLRPAYYQLAPYVHQTGADQFVLDVGGTRHPIASR
jgi:hypothetical protein